MSTVDEHDGDAAASVEHSPKLLSVPRIWYTDPLLDVAALVAAAAGDAVYSLGYLPTLMVTGKDRLTWLNGLLTCDVLAVRSSVAAWGLLLDRVGKVQATLGLVAHGETLLIGVLWGNVQEVHHQLDMRLVMEDAELEVAADWHWSVGIGTLTAAPNDSAAWGNVALGGACSLVAEPSFTWAGARQTLSDAAWALWRLRCELPWGGIDFDNQVRPHDAALDRKAVSWSKGCYLGQEVVCMQDMRGKVKKRLAVFTTTGDSLTAQTPGGIVRRNGTEVGKVTSAVYEPNEQRWTLFALVPTAALPEVSSGNEAEGSGALERGASNHETELEWAASTGPGLHLRWTR